MLDVLFGWRKASKCKKLIRKVQCRLKLLKNKRSFIVSQLRDDVAQLLKHGHEQNAFDRVEQIYLDESIVVVYDLLDNFCEFIILRLSYIRRHKDCPEDIGEAVSTLVFASARFGDLPELKKIRKLFGERYGQKFAEISLELLPGNLVNHQIKENLSIQSVANDIKWSLVDEIWQSCLRTGPLAIEYYPQIQQEPDIKIWENEVAESDVQSKYTIYDETQMQAFGITEEEGKIVSQSSYLGSTIDSSSTHSSTVINSSSSSLELVYIDDIEEYKSPMSTNVNSQDQRLFMFKSSVILSNNKLQSDVNESSVDKSLSPNENSASRRIRKSKRQRRRSLSRESSSVKNYDSIMYYGEGEYSSRKSHGRKHRKKIPTLEITKSCAKVEDYDPIITGVVQDCNLMQPSNFPASSDKYGIENKITATDRFIEGFGDNISNRKESKAPYLRIMTMPPQRTNDSNDENMVRTNSFPIKKPINEYPACRHVHPKLPDYDELAATFTALKKANSQIKSK